MTEWLTLGIRRVVEIADDIFLKEKKDVCFVSRLIDGRAFNFCELHNVALCQGRWEFCVDARVCCG